MIEGSESLEVKSSLLAIGVVPNLDGAVSEKLKLDTMKGLSEGRRKL
jgi:pyruvate/2-oxoglutarate dehydrogenase complex dihydrolipoamide dehydrogenase (E3) component